MFTKLVLHDFKNFRRAELQLGPLTTLLGTNASGKSNVRDAFRFLHGIGRGYSLAEILGQKWGDEGVLLWRGIRGGVREVSFHGTNAFSLAVSMVIEKPAEVKPRRYLFDYRITVEVMGEDLQPRVVGEELRVGRNKVVLFRTVKRIDQHNIKVHYHRGRRKGRYPPSKTFINSKPVLHQITDDEEIKTKAVKVYCKYIVDSLVSFRFLDLSPEAMRQPSLPGQTVLGDRGENLSSVLYAICADEGKKRTLLEWLKELTPMDAQDFTFPTDQAGRILLALSEQGGKSVSAYSASDGTLRFLAMIAALLGPEPAQHYFFEEMDNGIHPTRLSLLLELIERRVSEGRVQLITTTHSPQLLGLLSPDSLNYASLTCRLPGTADARIKRIIDIPDANRVLREQSLAHLHASGWLEDAVAFTEPEEALS